MNYQNLLDSLNRNIKILSSEEIKKEQFFTGSLAKKASLLANEFSYDPTIIGMRNFLLKRAENNLWISRNELKKAYSYFESPHNKFKDYFQEELMLGSPAILKPTKTSTNNTGSKISENSSSIIDSIVDPEIKQAISQLFEIKNTNVDVISNNLAKLATDCCKKTLENFSPSPKSINVGAGNSQAIICQALYETPKGVTSINIPLEINNGYLKFPDRFFSSNGLIALNTQNLQEHLIKNAGTKFHTTPQNLLENFAPISMPNQDLDLVNLAFAQLELEKQAKQEYKGSSVLNFSLPKIEKKSELPTEIQEEMKSFADYFNNNANLAKLDFGNLAEKAKNLIEYKLSSLGFKNYDISIKDSNSDGIQFNVKLNAKLAFKVPVKINKLANQIFEPQIILASGQIEEFTLSGIENLNQLNPDLSALNYNHEDSPIQILAQIESSLSQNQFEKAASLLQVLNETKDSGALRIGFSIYQQALKDGGESLRPKTAHSHCKLQLKTANSQFAICGHTNLPLSQVSQDNLGNCIPNYRKYLDNTDMGKKLISHQICWS